MRSHSEPPPQRVPYEPTSLPHPLYQAMVSSQRQKYFPLDHTRHEIRMLALSGSMRASIVVGKLIHVDLDDLDAAPFAFYEALSYTWGDVNDTVRCKINGFDHQITRNLDAALRSLRGRTRPRHIWVDAVCINQEDPQERARQVRMMQFIFQRAVQVLVWLGPPGDDAEEAMKLLEYITDEDSPDDYVQRTLQQQQDLPRWQAVASFFDRPWFRRVWVRQEVAWAKEVMVLCSLQKRHKIKWPVLVQACDFIDDYLSDFEMIQYHISMHTSGIRQVTQIDSMCELVRDGKYAELEMLLLHGRGTEATDPRDRVYGLLSLAGPQGDDIEINYLLSPQEIYRNATICLLEQRQSLDPLSGCQWSNSTPVFPSWVLNLEADFKPMVLRSRDESEDAYYASANTKARFSFDQDKSVLRVDGHILDVIDTIGIEMVALWSTEYVPGDTDENWLNLVTRSYLRQGMCVSDSNILAAFCRTIIADLDHQGRAVTSFIEPYATCSDNIKDFGPNLTAMFQKESSFFRDRMGDVCINRRMFGTPRGYFGLAGESCLPGDKVCILFGAGVPFILRPIGNEYILIGEAYVHGIMDGEAIIDVQDRAIKTTTFRIR